MIAKTKTSNPPNPPKTPNFLFVKDVINDQWWNEEEKRKIKSPRESSPGPFSKSAILRLICKFRL
jgi:hypothetical protein